jgi:hypothetical protein
MTCELERLYRELGEKLPTSPDDEMHLTTTNLPLPPARLTTDRLYIIKASHEYDPGEFLADYLQFHAHKSTYRYMGLLILAVVFHAQPGEIEIELTHPASEIKRIIVESPFMGADDIHGGYNKRPYVFCYSPEETSRFPWDTTTSPHLFPCFYLTKPEGWRGPPEVEREARDVVRGFGSDDGCVRLAELLLNASQPSNPVNEYSLEGDGGFRGVGYLSAEARFWLPGSDGWDPGKWDEDT